MDDSIGSNRTLRIQSSLSLLQTFLRKMTEHFGGSMSTRGEEQKARSHFQFCYPKNKNRIPMTRVTNLTTHHLDDAYPRRNWREFYVIGCRQCSFDRVPSRVDRIRKSQSHHSQCKRLSADGLTSIVRKNSEWNFRCHRHNGSQCSTVANSRFPTVDPHDHWSG